MKKNSFVFCLSGTILLAMGVVFLPRYISRSLDLRSINRIVLTDRDMFSYMEQSAYDLPGNDTGFKSLQNGTGELTLIASFDRQKVRLNEELLQGVEEELITFTDAMGHAYWSSYDYGMVSPDLAYSAEYYSLVYPSEEDSRMKQMLNFWMIYYTDMLGTDCCFLVNEDNYKIYYAWIYNTYTEEICSFLEQAPIERASMEQNPKEPEMFMWDIFSLPSSAEGYLYYYEADFYSEVFWPEYITAEESATVTLVFDAENVIAEERILPAGPRDCRGLGIGLQSAGDILSPF